MSIASLRDQIEIHKNAHAQAVSAFLDSNHGAAIWSLLDISAAVLCSLEAIADALSVLDLGDESADTEET